MNLGMTLRRHRKEQKLTLKAVAEKAGVSEGFLSQVENNVKSPSLDTLMSICEALGLDVGRLLEQVQSRERLFLVRQSEWEDVEVPHTGFATRRFCPPEDRTVIDSGLLFIEPRKSIPVRKNLKNGQEILCVLRGSVELTHGEQVLSLVAGDSVHLWTDPQRQSVTNVGRGRAVVLWVGTF